MLSDILIARAHIQIGNNLLVTLSPRILSNRDKGFIRDSNVCTPVKAAKILGLFLRSRQKYIIEASNNFTHDIGRGFFYWVLARHRLPRMWKYFSACVHSEQFRNDGVADLGGSILIRCTRALAARDNIGIQFYCPQSNTTRDTIMYHFDYLTLLLSGAFDAQARVARRAYGIEKPNERITSFRSHQFRQELGKNGAGKLEKIVSSQVFLDLMTLLTELRNTVHGASLRSIGYHEPAEEEKSYVALHKESTLRIWEAAMRYSSPEDWGLLKGHEIIFEPYTYSITIINESFRFVNAIAHATDVTKLFPKGKTYSLENKPPEESIFRKHIRKRVHVLG